MDTRPVAFPIRAPAGDDASGQLAGTRRGTRPAAIECRARIVSQPGGMACSLSVVGRVHAGWCSANQPEVCAAG
jgi:hypothetical protein